MLVSVQRLRDRGRRLTPRELNEDPGRNGDLRTHIESFPGHGPVTVAVLVDVTNGLAASLLPNLYEPSLVGVAPLAMHLRGIEKIKDGEDHRAVVQEWLCFQVK